MIILNPPYWSFHTGTAPNQKSTPWDIESKKDASSVVTVASNPVNVLQTPVSPKALWFSWYSGSRD